MSKTKWFVVRKLPHQPISFSWRNSEAQKCCTIFTRSPFPLWGLGSKLTQVILLSPAPRNTQLSVSMVMVSIL